MTDDPLLYPGTAVLRNRLGIRDGSALDAAERLLVTQRAAEIIPSGQFDLEHLRAIHWHLFQDLYEWAGHIRTTEISKNGQQFQFRRFIETGMSDIHRRLETADHLKNLSPSEFTKSAGRITGDLNYVHPFREGNGRAQLQYLKQLAEQAGHPIDLLLLDPAPWLEASRAAYSGDYTPMSDMLASALAQN